MTCTDCHGFDPNCSRCDGDGSLCAGCGESYEFCDCEYYG